ncbi:MAG: glycoside hydrolase family 9 protein, partial [bacterium]
DYLVRVKNPKGSFYRTVSGRGPKKAPEDRCISPAMKGFSIKTIETKNKFNPNKRSEIIDEDTYEVGYRAGAGLSIAALAMASTFNVSGDFENDEYLKVAEDASNFLEENNLYFTNDGKENIVDDYCALAAATELYKATVKNKYKAAADKRAQNLMDRLITNGKYKNYFRADDGDRPFFHAVDAGLPVVSLLYYMDVADSEMKKKVLDAVKKAMTFELEVTEEVSNPFGYARQYVQNKKGDRRTSFFYPHDCESAPWWQGENARLGSLVTAARLTAKYFNHDKEFYDKLQAYAWNQLNWILGLNPFDACMLHGSGRNNPWYMFFESYEYTNAPGGICNGITAGLYDEDDIDFNVPFSVTGKDNDWRWGEQWLPHASWFLLAISTRE